jgi:hypothetical protein
MADRNLQVLRNEKGQSVVEYILLLVVVMSLSATVYNSDAFKKFMGPNSEFFKALSDSIEFSYRHGLQGFEDTTDYNSLNHPTYTDGSKTRFFLPQSQYPE